MKRFRRYTGFGLLAIFVLWNTCTLFPPLSEAEWYSQNALRLKNLQAAGQLPPKKSEVIYRSGDKRETFLFPNGDWICITWHSVHDKRGCILRRLLGEVFRKPVADSVGDAVLGLGSDGNLYVSGKHVCGGPTLSVPDGCASLGNFLAVTADDAHWEPYTGKPPSWKQGKTVSDPAKP